ncbi:sialin-like [Uloborus diversus]|uniref:sialin-like n=1 Tax=Uloborus diversus TaxID=327109 RepID=UPI00240A6F66|nr:sialin-like [Uloborus diversus]
MAAYRINISVAMVAMVDLSGYENHTLQQNWNVSSGNSSQVTFDQGIKYNWSPKIQGCVIGAGFLGYVLSLIAGGKLAETFGPTIVLIIGTFTSSFSTTVSPLTSNISPYFTMLIQCVRGVAQGLMLPAMTVLSANWFPRSERGFLSGLSLSGGALGVLVTGILSSLICDSVSLGGWPSVFYIFGGFGILLSVLQTLSLKSLPKDDLRISKEELRYILENQENEMTIKRPAAPWGQILYSMPTYALLLASFGQYWMIVHFVSVHATFLATVLRYPITETGTLISVPFLLRLICNVSSSFLSSCLTTNNYLSLNKVRKLWNLIGSVIYSLCLALIIFSNSENTVTIVCTILGIGSTGFMNSSIMVIALDMSPTFSGSLMGLSTTVGSLSGFILPVVYGILTNEEQTVQQWNKFFIISIVIVMSSAIFFCIFGSAEIQSYNSSEEKLSLKTEGEAKSYSKVA